MLLGLWPLKPNRFIHNVGFLEELYIFTSTHIA
jgi:hypothetical protein